ncbi:MAG: hypothetical protein CTY19_12920 [Methylomonas sp.]|nr:MAG: hypothetical protein CTY19_12920 [Methylomonas sp.]
MSIIKLLIAKSADGHSAIDADVLTMSNIEVCYSEWDALMKTVSIDADVVLLIDHPGLNGLLAIHHLRTIAPACRIIVTLQKTSMQAVAYLQAGAVGVLDALPDSPRMAEIIRRVYQGDYYLDQVIAQLLAMRQIKKLLEPFDALSSREFDVFCQLAEGCSLKAIAEQLGISSKTVSNCQTAIKLKLSLDSRQAINKFAKYHGLVK